jgi:L-amino acid N-acyltransferase YncA
MSNAVLRLASPADAAAILGIYAPNVRETIISFELEPPSVEEMARRIEAGGDRYAWLVCERGGEVAGYAYASSFRPRAAYRWAVEVSVYVSSDHQRRGVGHALYERLLRLLELQRFHLAIATIGLPNDASVLLHERHGFRPVGVFPEAGYKFGRWVDVGMWQRPLLANPAADEPLPYAAVSALALPQPQA